MNPQSTDNFTESAQKLYALLNRTGKQFPGGVALADPNSTLENPRKSLTWSIKAPDQQKREVLSKFSRKVKDDGLDICRVIIGFAEAYLAADTRAEKAAAIGGTQKVINIRMNNRFLYQVSKPRREPFSLDCVKPEFRRTFSSILFEAYVLEKARKISQEFSYRDFLELKHDAFRRIALRLKRKGLIVANPERTIPRFYVLAERIKVK